MTDDTTATDDESTPGTVPTPVRDSLFDADLDVLDGDFDRDRYVALARDLYDIDTDVLAEKPTGWIVARVRAEDNRYYKP